jgi:hypothetical protein
MAIHPTAKLEAAQRDTNPPMAAAFASRHALGAGVNHGSLSADRALVIVGLGPTLSAAGLVWSLVSLLRGDAFADWRAIVFAPSVQIIVAGLLLFAICWPVVDAIRASTPEQTKIPDFDALLPTSKGDQGTGHRSARRRSRYS